MAPLGLYGVGSGSVPAPGLSTSRGHALNHQRAEKPPTPGVICHRVPFVTAGLLAGAGHGKPLQSQQNPLFPVVFPTLRAVLGGLCPPGRAGTVISFLISLLVLIFSTVW